jgi:hypothetical protein
MPDSPNSRLALGVTTLGIGTATSSAALTKLHGRTAVRTLRAFALLQRVKSG